MAKKTDVAILKLVLEHRKNQRGSRRALKDQLLEERKWDEEKVDRVIDKALADPYSNVLAGAGGVIKYMGSEKAAGSPLYADVELMLCHHWAKDHHLRDPKIYHTAHSGHHGWADWIHPDVVLRGLTKKSGKDDGRRLHSFEVEKLKGFSLTSVFQAYVQGRGSDYSWVIFNELDVATDDYQDRVLWAARSVGVGLIALSNPGAYSTWAEWLPAKRRSYTVKERSDFIDSALGGLVLP
jgi:hypothetical protein